MHIEILKPGLATTVQDLGRQGNYHLGIPPSGGMDLASVKTANWLVGNDEDAAVLECSLMGPTLRFATGCLVAACGADMAPLVDGQPRAINTAFCVPEGSELSFGFVRDGARLYLAVAGGIDVPHQLGSRSTYTLGRLGGVEGRPLKAEDRLPLAQPQRNVPEGRTLPHNDCRFFGKSHELRVVTGLYEHRVMPESIEQFYSETWSVASEADRIGYRLKGGSALTFKEREPPFGAGSDPSNIVDACYPVGSIQVPSGSEPIILHRDAVSGGGYATIATVISADMNRVGQMQPHHQVHFTRVSMEEALQARREEQKRLERLKCLLIG
ncbi:5-oxoprolinase subunit C family protein [Phytohalomonas tamaricis]|uniref:5-oxoprolinase subunit C family protein n=1 Tax=Phytohalomonas tamaricis TaxID=2081032 RepID=UPI000D0B620D|nr:biotin-dependent carboxyltransferase family protein [Phytohalomonas tamaricis]